MRKLFTSTATSSILIILLKLTIHLPHPIEGVLYENDRMDEYHRRNHTWPPNLEDYIPPTPGWSKLYNNIFQQLQYSAHESPGERYEAYMGMVHSGLTSQNFTTYGWGVTKAPKIIVDKLKQRLYAGLDYDEDKKKYESPDVCLETDLVPYFIPNEEMNTEILHELLPLHEAWSGVELVPHNAYGLRVYRNNSNLLMHLDKQDTHVISSILHIDHGEDDEPWPLVIEDFHGNTNEIYLESGDLLFYESSKCRHGRPKKSNGRYYSSLFSHYYPKENWNTDEKKLDIHYRIPSRDIWNQSSTTKEAEKDGVLIDDMSLVSLCMKEPDCQHEWCQLLRETKKWNGPGPAYGNVLSGDGIIRVLENIPAEDSFEERFGDEF